MNLVTVGVWSLEIVVALAFLMAGAMKAFQPAKAKERMAWAREMSDARVRAIGVVELLGALGLVLPRATGILPWLTPLAAIGLALTMLGAIGLHVKRRDGAQVVPSVVLLALCVTVAVGTLAA